MVELTGSDTYFTNIDATFTATKWEGCIMQALRKINGYARDDILPEMTGTAGSRTVSLTSGQTGFVCDLAAAIYANQQNAGADSQSINLGPMGQSSSSSSRSGATQVDEMAKEAEEMVP